MVCLISATETETLVLSYIRYDKISPFINKSVLTNSLKKDVLINYISLIIKSINYLFSFEPCTTQKPNETDASIIYHPNKDIEYILFIVGSW